MGRWMDGRMDELLEFYQGRQSLEVWAEPRPGEGPILVS